MAVFVVFVSPSFNMSSVSYDFLNVFELCIPKDISDAYFHNKRTSVSRRKHKMQFNVTYKSV